MIKKINSKKAMELSMSTIVVFILAIIVLIVIVFMFKNGWTENNQAAANVGKSAIDAAKNYTI